MTTNQVSLLFPQPYTINSFYKVLASLISGHHQVLNQESENSPKRLFFIHKIHSIDYNFYQLIKNDIETSDCEATIRNMTNHFLGIDENTPILRERLYPIGQPQGEEETWKEEINSFIQDKIQKHFLIHVPSYYWGDFSELTNLKKPKELAENNILSIQVESFFSCESLISEISEKTYKPTHFIINSSIDGCYSKTLIKDIRNCKPGLIKSVSVLDEKTKITTLTKDEYILKLYLTNRENGAIRSIKKLLDFIYKEPKCFFSYASRDHQNQNLMAVIEKNLSALMPFSKFNRDDKPENTFDDIDEYVQRLIAGDIVIAIIGPNYLKRPYPMYEFLSIMERKGVIKNDKLLKGKVKGLAKDGFFPIILGNTAKNLIYSKKNKLRDEWLSKKEEYKKEYDINKIEKILLNIENIQTILSTINRLNIQKTEVQRIIKTKKEDDLCRVLGWHLIKAINKKLENHYNIYGEFKEPDDIKFLQ